jgi:hypothetical protein
MSDVSFLNLRPEKGLTPERVIEECFSIDSKWVPTLSFVLANTEGLVGMSRRQGGRWFLPKGTINPIKFRSGQLELHDAVDRTAYARARSTFGGKTQVQDGTVRVLPFVKRIETHVEGIEKKWWPKAVGVVVLPAIAIVDAVPELNQAESLENFEHQMFGSNNAVQVLREQLVTGRSNSWVFETSLQVLELAGASIVEHAQLSGSVAHPITE